MVFLSNTVPTSLAGTDPTGYVCKGADTSGATRGSENEVLDPPTGTHIRPYIKHNSDGSSSAGRTAPGMHFKNVTTRLSVAGGGGSLRSDSTQKGPKVARETGDQSQRQPSTASNQDVFSVASQEGESFSDFLNKAEAERADTSETTNSLFKRFSSTSSLKVSISVPAKLIELGGGDSGGADVGLSFGLAQDDTGDVGVFFSRQASSGLSIPFTSDARIPRVGAFVEFGRSEGSLRELAGQETFVEISTGFLRLGGSRSDTGQYGGSIGFGGGIGATVGRSATSVVSVGSLLEGGYY